MVDLKSFQGVLLAIDPKQILVGFSQSVRLPTNVHINFLYDFLWDLYFFDNLFDNLLNFSFLFLGPARLDHLLDKIIIVFRELRANVIIDTAFGLEGFNHVPLS
jgi:hypothetical protein